MKPSSSRNRLLFTVTLVLVAVLSCQTLTERFDPIAATSTLQTSQNTQISPSPTNSLPHTVSPTATPTLIPIDIDQQLEIFQSLWEAVNEDYLYSDFNGLDWSATYDQYRAKIEAGLDTDAFYLALDEMIYALGDEHSIYLNPREVEAEEAEFSSGHDYVGIGVWVQYLPEKQHAVILLTFPEGPADQAGLKSRDVIQSVEGNPLTDETGAALDLLLGVEGTPVTLTVQSPGGAPRTITIPRGRITSSLPVPYELLQTPSGKQIGYIIIPTFSDSTIDVQVGQALADLNNRSSLDGLILDNRLNGGGWDSVMSATLAYFTSGRVGYFVNRTDREALTVPRKNVGGSADLPLVVLIGPDTVSFGEIFAGILKDQARATLIGETTTGNVEILWGYNFDDGSRAWIAHDTFKPINHPEWDWEHEGIVVDIEAAASWDAYTTQTDPAIQAALAHLDQ